MAIDVVKVEITSVMDASGLEEHVRSGRMQADEIVAVIGKTEGNGGVNDFTRILSDQAFRAVLTRNGTRSEAEVKAIPMVWSGGLRRRHYSARDSVCPQRGDRPQGSAAPCDGNGHEPQALARGHRAPGHGGEGGGRGAAGDAGRWNQ